MKSNPHWVRAVWERCTAQGTLASIARLQSRSFPCIFLTILKPSNVSNARLEQYHPSVMIVGTVQYMSPEQLQGHEADARSDLFVLGAVLYDIITGRRAFPGKSQISVLSAILEKDPDPIT